MPCTPSFLLDAPSTVARDAHLPERRMASLGRHAEFSDLACRAVCPIDGPVSWARRAHQLAHTAIRFAKRSFALGAPLKTADAWPTEADAPSQRADGPSRLGDACVPACGARYKEACAPTAACGAWRLWAGAPSPLPGESSKEPTWRCQRAPLQSRQYKYKQLGAGMGADRAWLVGGRTLGRRLVFRTHKTLGVRQPRRESRDQSMTYQLGSGLRGCFRQTSGNGAGWSNCS